MDDGAQCLVDRIERSQRQPSLLAGYDHARFRIGQLANALHGFRRRAVSCIEIAQFSPVLVGPRLGTVSLSRCGAPVPSVPGERKPLGDCPVAAQKGLSDMAFHGENPQDRLNFLNCAADNIIRLTMPSAGKQGKGAYGEEKPFGINDKRGFTLPVFLFSRRVALGERRLFQEQTTPCRFAPGRLALV